MSFRQEPEKRPEEPRRLPSTIRSTKSDLVGLLFYC